jgi:hypothetical protein
MILYIRVYIIIIYLYNMSMARRGHRVFHAFRLHCDARYSSRHHPWSTHIIYL